MGILAYKRRTALLLDTEEQLARLRQRIAVIDRKFSARREGEIRQPSPPFPPTTRCFIEEWSEGQVMANDHGEHFQMERLFPAHKRHGVAEIGALSEMPHDFLDALSGNEISSAPPQRWAFLDTETTGLAGGSGTYAFLVGVGRITAEGFRVRQFFMRDYDEERSSLAALDEHLKDFDVLITYNGKSYDQPLLETRFRMNRMKPPFGSLSHLDLLYGARRLWKLRLENCRLVQLEEQILGVIREGDLPGELIPYVYFEYVRAREAHRMVPVFHHNAMDILTLACLTGIVPAAFRSHDRESLARVGVRRGEDLSGIARWLMGSREFEAALALMRRSIDAGLPDRLLFRSLWDTAVLERKCGRRDAALNVLAELAGCKNEYRVNALEELAKFYEHQEKNFSLALDFTCRAIDLMPSPTLLRRKTRLEKRLSKPAPRKLFKQI
ncbi:MAG: ribonuclease H-like domain-containing protein [Bryobacteraceae bacterium]